MPAIVTGVANVVVYPPEFINNPPAYMENEGNVMSIYGDNVVCVREQLFYDKNGIERKYVVIDGTGGQSYVLKEANYNEVVAALFNI